jgi:hypothetical protein
VGRGGTAAEDVEYSQGAVGTAEDAEEAKDAKELEELFPRSLNLGPRRSLCFMKKEYDLSKMKEHKNSYPGKKQAVGMTCTCPTLRKNVRN